MDQGLSLVLKAYPFPVFVLGAQNILDYFRQITNNERHIVGYVHGNFEEASEARVRAALRSYLDDWQQVRQTSLLHQLRAAEDEGKLTKGIRQVWEAAPGRRARLLVVEKGFMEDKVETILEKILAGGAEIQFVEAGVLRDYGQIALVY